MISSALIVDDEQSIQRLLKMFLEREGFAVRCASTIGEAEEILKAEKFDLIIADIFIGKSNGIDLLRHIKSLDKNAQVALITGLPDVESAAEALRLGAFDYLTKPISFHQIISTAQRALYSKRLIEESERKQANLDAIFQSASDGIMLVDSNNRLIQFNEASMRSCGYTADQLGMPALSIKAGCGGTCRQMLAEVLSDGTQRNLRRLECRKINGPKRIISISVSPVFDKSGTVDGAVAIMRDETELVSLEKRVHRQNGYSGIMGQNAAMQRMYTLIEALSDVQTTVLVNGESGTGKELVAAALHHQGVRRDKPFVKVNCAALSEHLLESELFGHVRGAYTGAVSAQVGRFQKADGGTIFLDEIGDISPAMQMRLLRVLQEQEFEPVGDSNSIKVDVRVIAATNQDLAEKVRLGTFRSDLYYRLNVVRLIIPPLKDRRDDIPLLVEHFLEKFSRKFKRPLSAVSRDVLELFMHHSWPGNVRELEHTLEHAAILCPSTVLSVEDLPQDFISAVRHHPHDEVPDSAFEKQLTLAEALEKAGGNKAKAARLLGVSRCTIYRKLQEDPTLLDNSL
ncbi:sigma-54-dependent Fis family transcriptional regulator [Pelotalea chapellei]|uniref:Sigma 54-interacting transcriptional regulator n=1 Tax=Pelotalea chapellei TaxID=44671 RepID=A0ABS5U4G6_9BACT|nr:sigma-54-dependent Fis family transcriptional regulator [Pelotalea chapellei]MBT1070537.1 sigma 54-interacting transcriptional regulator [Pelotalea chapellei]